MAHYKHILLVTDLREDCDTVVKKAKYMLAEHSRLSVVHIVEEAVLAGGYEIVPIVPLGNEDELHSKAQSRMKEVLEKHNLTAQDVHIDTALSTRRGILEYAAEIKPNLIVIGRHTRTGLSALLGATADDILPKVECDVLVVKLGAPV
ncbi:MAG: universal stress protein [Cardiobacteriaceae bacterium]|nr:universal stress protein [Cardiobacteriaceae bacterium]MBR1375769.1 universal stress protein [Cardiobacteriaceae bacterium]